MSKGLGNMHTIRFVAIIIGKSLDMLSVIVDRKAFGVRESSPVAPQTAKVTKCSH